MPDANLIHTSPAQLKNLRNKTVLITGGSSGIGLATAQMVASLSDTNNVIIVDRSPPPANISIPSSRLLFQKCEITNWVQQRAAFAAGAKKFGQIDAVFVNTGITEYGDQFFKEEFDADGLLKEPDRRCLDIDMNAACDTVRLAIHHLRKNGKEGRYANSHESSKFDGLYANLLTSRWVNCYDRESGRISGERWSAFI